MRVHENEGLQLVRRRPHRLERGIVRLPAVDVRADLGAAQTEHPHGAHQLVRRPFRILQRQGGESHEAIGITADDSGDLVVLQASASGAEFRLLVIEEGVHGGADGLHLDAVLVHVGKPQIEVPAFRRHRPLHYFARDLHDRRAVALRNQLRRHARRFLAEPPDRLLRQHVGVDVDGAAGFHRRYHTNPTTF